MLGVLAPAVDIAGPSSSATDRSAILNPNTSIPTQDSSVQSFFWNWVDLLSSNDTVGVIRRGGWLAQTRAFIHSKALVEEPATARPSLAAQASAPSLAALCDEPLKRKAAV